MLTEFTQVVLELVDSPRRLALEMAEFFTQTGFIIPTVKMVPGSSKFLCRWPLTRSPTRWKSQVCRMDGLDRATLGVRVKLGQNLPAAVQDTPSVALSKPSIRQTWLSYPVGDIVRAHMHKTFQPPATMFTVGMMKPVCVKNWGGVYSVGRCSMACKSVTHKCKSVEHQDVLQKICSTELH